MSPVQVCPNPARESVFIRLAAPGRLRISDITGREMYFSEADGEHRVDVSCWSKDCIMYWYRQEAGIAPLND